MHVCGLAEVLLYNNRYQQVPVPEYYKVPEFTCDSSPRGFRPSRYNNKTSEGYTTEVQLYCLRPSLQ
jgi:hypothetical protein